jgi:hypothetical protein
MRRRYKMSDTGQRCRQLVSYSTRRRHENKNQNSTQAHTTEHLLAVER